MNVLVDGEIVLYGTVGTGFFADGFTALDVITALAQIGRHNDVTVRINSGGGIATEGSAIYNALDSHRGNKTIIIESIAASAASVIAMAGDEVIMRTGAMMMVHDPATFTIGNSSEHDKAKVALETIASSMADIYAEKTGRPVVEIREEMKAETWLSATEAVAKGYADKIQKGKGKSKAPTAFDYRLYSHAPERMVALAQSRGWEHHGSTGGDAVDNQEDIEMTDQEKAADKATADAAAAKATADAAAAKATADAAAAKATADASALDAETKRCSDITAACVLAGQANKAPGYIAEKKQVSEVLAALAADRSTHADAELSARTSAAASAAAATASSWDKAIARLPGHKAA